MPRPRYENKESLEQEQSFGTVIQLAWNCELVKMPMQYKIDYCCYRDNNLIGFVELKNRTCTKSRYPTYILSLSKYLTAVELSRILGKPTNLCVRWTDETGYVRLDTIRDPHISQGGRTDRNDWQDVEPVIHIDINSFIRI